MRDNEIMKIKKLAVLLGSTLLAGSSLMAQQLGIDFSGGGFNAIYCPGYSVGYTFQVTSPVTLIGLAAYDPDPSQFPVVQVGLWNNGGSLTSSGSSPGSLITSATIAAHTPATVGLGNLFADVDITPIILQPGYYDVASFGSEFTGAGAPAFSALNSLTVATGITFVEDSFTYGADALSYPNMSDQWYYGSSFVGWFGGNVVLSGTGNIVSVSVPDSACSLVLLSGACVALGALRRKFA